MKRFFLAPSISGEQFASFAECLYPSYRWYSLVNAYFTRDITVKKDVFPAISGLAREIQIQTGKTYDAGIWIEELHGGLLWATNGVGRMSEACHAPSWSWASVEFLSEASFPEYLYWNVTFTEDELTERRASLISYEVAHEDGDSFGCVSSGFIRICGKCLTAKQWQGKTRPHFSSYTQHWKSHYYDIQDPSATSASKIPDELICFFDISEEDITPKEKLAKAIMLQISTWNWTGKTITLALLLIQVEEGPKGTYRRVGIAEVPNVEGLSDEGWEMKEVTII